MCSKSFLLLYCKWSFLQFARSLQPLFYRAHIRENNETSSPKVFVFQMFVFEDGCFETTNHLFAQFNFVVCFTTRTKPFAENSSRLLFLLFVWFFFFTSNPIGIYLRNLSYTAAIETACPGTDGTSPSEWRSRYMPKYTAKNHKTEQFNVYTQHRNKTTIQTIYSKQHEHRASKTFKARFKILMYPWRIEVTFWLIR